MKGTCRHNRLLQKTAIAIAALMMFCVTLPAQDNLDLGSRIGKVDSSGIIRNDGYYVWCTSVIKGDDGKYHMFYSRWKHGTRTPDDDPMNYIFNGFRGWGKYSEIAYAVSDRIEGPYRYQKTILKGDGDKAKWDRFTMHNPQVRKFGRYYYLYYISNSYDSSLYAGNTSFSEDWKHWLRYNSTQKIGVLKFKSFSDLVAGKYERAARPLVAPDSVRTFEVATNPTVTQGPDGRYYMMYKSRKPNVGNMTFWMAVSNRPDGPFTFAGKVFTSADMACEDPCIWYDGRRKRFYAAAKYYSHSKVLAPQFGALVLITSTNGLDWKPAAHPLISLRELNMANAGKMQLAHLERPFIVTGEDGEPIALFAAAAIDNPFKAVEPVRASENTFGVYIPILPAKR